MKKIIFTVTNVLVFDQRMQRICTSLADAGYEVQLVGRKRKSSPPLSGQRFRQRRLPVWFGKGKLFYAEFNFRLFFYLLFKKANCICAIDLDTILPVYLVTKLKGIKRVYDAHEYFSQLDEVVSRPGIYRFWHGLEKKMIPRFRQGYTVCDSLAEEFRKNYGAAYQVIRNVPLLMPQADEEEKKEIIILYQGAVNKGRGLDKLAEAMKFVDSTLWVCGDGNFMEEMKKAVVAGGVTEKVVFFGMLNPEALKKTTSVATVAINPFEKKGLNQYLSLSNKFFDYIHAGIPQVAMNFPEYRKINGQYEVAILIDDLEPETIAGAINNLLKNPELYSKLHLNCLAARKVLNWQNEKERLLNFYSQLFYE